MAHHALVIFLILPQIVEEFAEKRICFHIVGGRLADNLGIARPALTLVTLRAVGRKIQEIILLTPLCIFKQAVDTPVGGIDHTSLFQIGVNYAAFKISNRRFLRITFNLHITESIKREVRLQPLLRTIGNVGIFLLCLTQIAPVEIALLQDFAKTQTDLGARRLCYPHSHPTGNILAQIQHQMAIRSVK